MVKNIRKNTEHCNQITSKVDIFDKYLVQNLENSKLPSFHILINVKIDHKSHIRHLIKFWKIEIKQVIIFHHATVKLTSENNKFLSFKN